MLYFFVLLKKLLLSCGSETQFFEGVKEQVVFSFSLSPVSKFPGGARPRPPLVYLRLWRSILFQPDQLWTTSTNHVVMPKW